VKGGNAPELTNTAATVRVRNGKSLTTDGPFAETKEQLGGCYLVEAAHRNPLSPWPRGFPQRVLAVWNFGLS
jgi:hypothetical protein